MWVSDRPQRSNDRQERRQEFCAVMCECTVPGHIYWITGQKQRMFACSRLDEVARCSQCCCGPLVSLVQREFVVERVGQREEVMAVGSRITRRVTRLVVCRHAIGFSYRKECERVDQSRTRSRICAPHGTMWAHRVYEHPTPLSLNDAITYRTSLL